MQSHGLHSISPMIEMLSRLGGCCKGGGKQQTGLQFWFLATGRGKGPVEIRTLSLPTGRDQNWSPVCCFDPPPLQQPPTLNHVSTPGMGIREIQKGLHGL